MDTYIDTLAPWEKRNTYYKDVKLGIRVKDLKTSLRNQTEEMIKAQIASAGEIISSQDRLEDVIKETGYDIKSVGQGMGGLEAAFEWGISDVVWFIEQKTEDLRDIMMGLHANPNKHREALKYKAEGDYAKGKMDDALQSFMELESLDKDSKVFIKNDFSICISLGMIYLFHKIDKNKALAYFDRAIKYVGPFSAYYTSYALLYKALIKRDFGLIEEAEKCSSEAIKLSPELAEAKYQNAQYNALLNRPEQAIPLLKKAIKEDIVYCLKIWREKDFEQIKPEITGLFEKIRNEKNEKVKEALKGEKESVISLNNTVKGFEKLGYNVSLESSVELFEDGNKEIDTLVQKNSIFDAHIAGILLSLLPKKLKREKELLRRKGNEIYVNLDKQIQELGAGVDGKKKKGGSVSFIIHLLFGQIVALPFGWYIGMPLGVCITEGLLFAICFYINVIVPQSQWKEVNDKQNEQEKLSRVIKKL